MPQDVLGSLPPELAEAMASVAPRLGAWGASLRWYSDVGSTNAIAVAEAERGAAEGLVVAADAQHAGRGRLGRSWFSPPGAGLYVSVVVRPDATSAALLTIAAGLGAAEGLERATGLRVGLKWPNDLYLDGRKVGGILTEGGTDRGGVFYAVVGMGINVTSMSFPRELASRATSLEAELGRPVDRGLVLAECLIGVATRAGELSAGERHAVLDGWRARAGEVIGRTVEWDAERSPMQGVVVAVDDDAALVVRTVGGLMRLISGEVRWK